MCYFNNFEALELEVIKNYTKTGEKTKDMSAAITKLKQTIVKPLTQGNNKTQKRL